MEIAKSESIMSYLIYDGGSGRCEILDLHEDASPGLT